MPVPAKSLNSRTRVKIYRIVRELSPVRFYRLPISTMFRWSFSLRARILLPVYSRIQRSYRFLSKTLFPVEHLRAVSNLCITFSENSNFSISSRALRLVDIERNPAATYSEWKSSLERQRRFKVNDTGDHFKAARVKTVPQRSHYFPRDNISLSRDKLETTVLHF